MVERSAHIPVATVALDAIRGAGHIARRFASDSVKVGTQGYVYTYPVGWRATRKFSQGLWQQGSALNDPATPALVESALATSSPVILMVKNPGRGNHFVLGSGRRPEFVSSTSARGTYGILDPGYFARTGLFPAYSNQFRDARLCGPMGGGGGLAATTADDVAGLVFTLSGRASASITDPSGHVVAYDPNLGGYGGSIPDAVATRRYNDNDADESESVAGDGLLDVFEIPANANGTYRVIVTGDTTSDVAVSVNSYGSSGVLQSASMSSSTSAGASELFNVTYDSSSGSVTLTSGGPLAVPDRPTKTGLAARVSPNPSRGSVSVYLSLPSPGSVDVGIFDLLGRRVGTLWSGLLRAGAHQFSWKPTGGYSGGVYFLRVRFGRESHAQAFVLIK